MGHLIDCQIAIVPWGTRARFRLGKVGLLRKGNVIFIAVAHRSGRSTSSSLSSSSSVASDSRSSNMLAPTNANSQITKFPITPESVEVMPAAIRFNDLKKDLFCRQANDENKLSTMIREIRVILKKEKLSKLGKADVLERLVATIPQLSSISSSDLHVAPVSARFKATDNLIINRYNTPCDEPCVPGANDLVASDGGRRDDSIESDDFGLRLEKSGKRGYPSDDTFSSSDIQDKRIAPSWSNSLRPILVSKTTKVKQNEQRQTLQSQARHGGDRSFQRLYNQNLTSIKIEGSREIPRQLWLRTSLTELSLTNCNLTSVPKQLETFSNTLTILALSNNSIDNIPRTFCCKMNNLRLLDLSHNQIETLPIEIKFFRRLVDLNISNNRLRMLPSTFSDLTLLQELNVAHNNLSQLPAFRMGDIKLKRLDVSYNPLDGAMNEANTFEVHPSFDEPFGYNENLVGPNRSVSSNRFPKLFELAVLRIVRCDRLLRLASEESLPRTIVSTIQRDVFKCYRCNRMNMLPAYNSTDILDYVAQVDTLLTTGNYRHGMTFMKLLCRSCFDT